MTIPPNYLRNGSKWIIGKNDWWRGTNRNSLGLGHHGRNASYWGSGKLSRNKEKLLNDLLLNRNILLGENRLWLRNLSFDRNLPCSSNCGGSHSLCNNINIIKEALYGSVRSYKNLLFLNNIAFSRNYHRANSGSNRSLLSVDGNSLNVDLKITGWRK